MRLSHSAREQASNKSKGPALASESEPRGRDLASKKVVEAREEADWIAESWLAGFERAGNDECHFLWIAAHGGGMCIGSIKHLLHPAPIWTAGRLESRGAFPDLGAMRARLDEDDIDPKRLKLVGYCLGSSFDGPF